MSLASNNEEKGVLSVIFSSNAVAQILDFFLDHKEFDYSPGEISKKTGLSFRTIFRELPNLEEIQLIYNNRKIGRTNLYKLNADLGAISMLEKFALEMSQLRSNVKTRNKHLMHQEKTVGTNPEST
jgi:DNA-binding IclR family transcriptional regulator